MKKEIKIGIFVIAVIFCLLWGINFLKGRDIFNRTDTFYTYYDDVTGIQTSTAVVIRGIGVGSVTRITFRPELDDRVEVQFNVKSGYRIPDDSSVKISSTSIIGSKVLELDLGDSPTFFRSGAVVPSGHAGGFPDISGEEWESMKGGINRLITDLNATLEQINGLLNDNEGNITGILAGLKGTAEGLDGMVNDKDGSLRNILADLDALTSTLSDGRVDAAVSNLESVSADLKDADIAATINNLNAAVAELDAALTKVNDGEGTLGMLISDPALYDSLAQASSNLSSLLADIKENPRRYVNISVFGGKRK